MASPSPRKNRTVRIDHIFEKRLRLQYGKKNTPTASSSPSSAIRRSINFSNNSFSPRSSLLFTPSRSNETLNNNNDNVTISSNIDNIIRPKNTVDTWETPIKVNTDLYSNPTPSTSTADIYENAVPSTSTADLYTNPRPSTSSANIYSSPTPSTSTAEDYQSLPVVEEYTPLTKSKSGSADNSENFVDVFSLGSSPLNHYKVHNSFVQSPLSYKGINNSRSTLLTPSRKIFADRFIPIRSGNDWSTRFNMRTDITHILIDAKIAAKRNNRDTENLRDTLAYSSLLRNELLGTQIGEVRFNAEEKKAYIPPSMDNNNMFQFSSPTKAQEFSPYSIFPVTAKSQKILRSPRKAVRKISRIPFKVLDAPELQDDFYLNLVDWSSQNVLSVGLGSCVYLWSACTSQVTRLCDLSSDGNTITSVSWNERGNLVAVGTHHGYVQIWDVVANKQINTLQGHTARVGALAWNSDMLSSGSRDRLILQRDVRSSCVTPDRKLIGHRQEVCGLKWSPDGQQLASGGNDNRLFVWNMHGFAPIQSYAEHLAAVKAIAWSPHHHGLLASGGGTADRCIRFWNTLTSQPMQVVDTGSQVCNLAWSKHSSELVSTHGYSQNQILVWKYPSLTQVAKLTGHSYRVLYLAMSPDGEAIVTGAGDETLRFWNVFSKSRCQKQNRSKLNLFNHVR